MDTEDFDEFHLDSERKLTYPDWTCEKYGTVILSYYIVNWTNQLSEDLCGLIAEYVSEHNPKIAYAVSDELRCLDCHGFPEWYYICSTCLISLKDILCAVQDVTFAESANKIYLFCSDKCMRVMGMTKKFKWNENSSFVRTLPEKHEPYKECCDGVISFGIFTGTMHLTLCSSDKNFRRNMYPDNALDQIFKLKEGMAIEHEYPIKCCECHSDSEEEEDD